MTAMWGGGGRYEAWASFLEAWSGGEPAQSGALPRLDPADFTAETWARLADRLTTAISRRLQSWADALGRALSAARDEFEVARALAHARTGLAAVRAVAGHPALPPDLAGRLTDLVDDQIHRVQRGLEEDVERLRRDGAPRDLVEARLRTVRDNSLGVVAGSPHTDRPDSWYVDPSVPSRRRVVP